MFGDGINGQAITGECENAEDHDGEDHHVVHPGLEPERDARVLGQRGRTHRVAQEYRIGGGEGGAEQECGGDGHIQQQNGSDGDEDRDHEGARSEQSPRQPGAPADDSQLQHDGVAEQDQGEGEGREHRQRRRRQPEIGHPQAVRTEQGAQTQERRNQRQPGALDRAR